MSVLDELAPGTVSLLERYGFDLERFESLRARVAAGELTRSSNVVPGPVEPPRADDLTHLPEPGTEAWSDARATGLEAIASGRVAQIVLAGGMATRFGSVVKGTVNALHGRSFLEWKLGETARLAEEIQTEIPIALMTSFATDEETRAHVAMHDLSDPLWFSQFVSLRLTPAGELFREEDCSPSLYGPGHGDLLEAVRFSGTLAALQGRGVELACVSNVDNLGARIDPVVVGAHLAGARPVTIEVADKEGDLGGAPALVGGRLMLLEAPRFPPGFDQDRIPVFNTNTAWIRLKALDRGYDLSWLYVEKDVDGRTAVQLERLYHEITTFVPTTYLVVPRNGRRGRFFPIKTPADLASSRDALREMLETSVLE
jgi:UTP--glucose-1-phosphate uridylyltransferase